MSLQNLGSNYPEGHSGKCIHGMVDDGVDCIQCKIGQVQSDLDDAVGYLDDWDENPEEDDYTGEIRPLLNRVKQFISKINPEIENWKRTVVELTHEKYQALCDVDKLKEFVQLVKECPENATHLMPIAADALLSQLHTETVVSEDKK